MSVLRPFMGRSPCCSPTTPLPLILAVVFLQSGLILQPVSAAVLRQGGGGAILGMDLLSRLAEAQPLLWEERLGTPSMQSMANVPALVQETSRLMSVLERNRSATSAAVRLLRHLLHLPGTVELVLPRAAACAACCEQIIASTSEGTADKARACDLLEGFYRLLGPVAESQSTPDLSSPYWESLLGLASGNSPGSGPHQAAGARALVAHLQRLPQGQQLRVLNEGGLTALAAAACSADPHAVEAALVYLREQSHLCVQVLQPIHSGVARPSSTSEILLRLEDVRSLSEVQMQAEKVIHVVSPGRVDPRKETDAAGDGYLSMESDQERSL